MREWARYMSIIKILLLSIPAINSALMVLDFFTYSQVGLTEEQSNKFLSLYISSFLGWSLTGCLGFILLDGKFEETKNKSNQRTGIKVK